MLTPQEIHELTIQQERRARRELSAARRKLNEAARAHIEARAARMAAYRELKRHADQS